jgi:hypothetical protein
MVNEDGKLSVYVDGTLKAVIEEPERPPALSPGRAAVSQVNGSGSIK